MCKNKKEIYLLIIIITIMHNKNYSIPFEIAMMHFFGELAHHLAEKYKNKTEVKKWYKKAIKKMLKLAHTIDTTIEHKEKIISSIEMLEKQFKHIFDDKDDIIITFFSICGILF